MSYFPAFIKLDDIEILIVGGGYIASEKLEHLLDFTKKIKIIAPQLSKYTKQMIDKHNLNFECRVYEKGDINDFGIVIVAIDNIALQEEIFNESKLLPNCLCNSVDSVNYCDFIFPSYIKKDDLTIAVSTSGSSPAMAKHLRKYLEKLIPNSIGDFLRQMKDYRTKMPKGKKRMEFLDKKAEEYISNWSIKNENK
jgi:precorrin-2 dehydrogenase/sirohydrochlorin ferrochelatase